jgi:hypothetical protein
MCNQCSDDSHVEPVEPVVDGCAVCEQAEDDCQCYYCIGCDCRRNPDRYSQCSNCNYCSDCCDCHYCEGTRSYRGCDSMVSDDDWCSDCERCENCCQCTRCDCGCTVNSYNETYACSNCNRCEEGCCDCSYCEGCSERVSGRVCRECDRCVEGCCECGGSDDDDDSNGIIHSYSYKPTAIYYEAENERRAEVRHYGIELEVNASEDKAEDIGERLGEHAYLKEDGSLTNGFEIVTHPHSRKAMRELWTRFFDQPVQGVTSYKTGQCGLHVHIERKGITDAHLRRMVVFMNAPENTPFIERVAQRSSNHYSEIKNKSLTTALQCESRYEALNLNNRRTVELRIFRGSYRLDRVMKALDFADALVEFTRDRSYQELTVKAFTEWLGKRVNQYRYLWLFLAECKQVQAGNRSLATVKPATKQRVLPGLPTPIVPAVPAEIEEVQI